MDCKILSKIIYQKSENFDKCTDKYLKKKFETLLTSFRKNKILQRMYVMFNKKLQKLKKGYDEISKNLKIL